MKFNTALLHGSFGTDKGTGATLTPIYQSSAFAQDSAEQIEKIFHNQAPGFAYTRIANPTIASFENRINFLEGGAVSVATSSGMAAIASTFLNILSSGNEIVSTASIYGGTLDLFRDLESYGIKTRYIKSITEENLARVVNRNTRAVFAETIANPKLEVLDIKAAADIIHSFHLPFILDNTTATPYLVSGIRHGADIIINSSSKYINGSSNSISGVITDAGTFKWTRERYPSMKDYVKMGKLAFAAKLKNDTFRNLGCCLSPTNAYLNSIGLETLSLRMEVHCRNALRLAEYLENQTGIRSVNYPLLKSNPNYELAMRQFDGKGGGIVTLRLYTKERAFDFINHLKYALNITNIGDTKTLVIHPASTIYAHSSDTVRKNAGVFEDLIRISVGIEDIEDIISDFSEALSYINNKHDSIIEAVDSDTGGTDKFSVVKNAADKIYRLFISEDPEIHSILSETALELSEHELGLTLKAFSNKLFTEYSWLELYIDTDSLSSDEVSPESFTARISKLFEEFCELYPLVNNDKIEEVIKYILNNPESDLKQKTIAAELYINSSYLSTVFATQTKMRFIDYLTSVKLKRATWLLLNTDIKVTDVALRLDYKDIGYFSRVFKRQYGVTPSEFRMPEGYTYQI